MLFVFFGRGGDCYIVGLYIIYISSNNDSSNKYNFSSKVVKGLI